MWPLSTAHGPVHRLTSDHTGTLWAKFTGEGLARYRGDQWEMVGTSREPHLICVVDGREGPESWLAHAGGLARLQADRWVETDAWPSSLPQPVHFARTDTLFGGPREWMGTLSSALWFRTLTPTPGAWTRFEHPDINGFVIGVLRGTEAGREALWSGAAGALIRIQDDGVRVWRAATGEVPTSILNMMVQSYDSTGQHILWVASRGGLLRLAFRLLTSPDEHTKRQGILRNELQEREQGLRRLTQAIVVGGQSPTLLDGIREREERRTTSRSNWSGCRRR
jgi:hypothetical protein